MPRPRLQLVPMPDEREKQNREREEIGQMALVRAFCALEDAEGYLTAAAQNETTGDYLARCRECLERIAPTR